MTYEPSPYKDVGLSSRINAKDKKKPRTILPGAKDRRRLQKSVKDSDERRRRFGISLDSRKKGLTPKF